MGVVHPSSEGVPGGLSADGQRRKMAGYGAPGSSVSRLYPSIHRTFPAKRLTRYNAAFLLANSPLYLFSFGLFWLCRTQFFHSYAQSCVACKLFTLWMGDLGPLGLPVSVLIHPEIFKVSYYNLPGWLCSQCEDGESLLCTFPLKLFFSFPLFLTTSPSLPVWLTLEFPTTACLLRSHSQSISCLSTGEIL